MIYLFTVMPISLIQTTQILISCFYNAILCRLDRNVWRLVMSKLTVQTFYLVKTRKVIRWWISCLVLFKWKWSTILLGGQWWSLWLSTLKTIFVKICFLSLLFRIIIYFTSLTSISWLSSCSFVVGSRLLSFTLWIWIKLCKRSFTNKSYHISNLRISHVPKTRFFHLLFILFTFIFIEKYNILFGLLGHFGLCKDNNISFSSPP